MLFCHSRECSIALNNLTPPLWAAVYLLVSGLLSLFLSVWPLQICPSVCYFPTSLPMSLFPTCSPSPITLLNIYDFGSLYLAHDLVGLKLLYIHSGSVSVYINPEFSQKWGGGMELVITHAVNRRWGDAGGLSREKWGVPEGTGQGCLVL